MWPLAVVIAPWLAGGAALGALAGRQAVENTRNRAELERLAAANRELAARVAALQPPPADPPKSSAKPRRNKAAPASGKTSFLQRIVQNNRELREDSDTQDNQEETDRG